jgi:hypothetical protein
MATIIGVDAGGGRLLTVRLDNGSAVTVDLEGKLRTARFSLLRDEAVFAAAATDGKAVYWPNGLSVDLDEILELAKR